MQRQSVSSSNVASVGYDEGTLEVEFNNGAVYQYFDVPQHIFEELVGAASVGAYLAAHIKGVYRYSKV
ncbi:KTSC domain-containing protein [Cellvibrio sp. pealriver]|uniref:KTSC domain-containing protein n=1 Tax=Cellvibrio sp. pealriver TaxID=1622269 RepID=UPI00066FE080|nr:KTSC domain-containing protein [Cellvibrio sp. pealriver]